MKEYKAVKADGVVVVILHKKHVLLLKRRNLPFIFNPGIWSFVTGSKKGHESYAKTAYREVEEETGITKEELRQVRKPIRVWMFDAKRRKKWQNHMFFFSSRTSNVRINIENSSWRWAVLSDIVKGNNYTNIFVDKDKIITEIARCAK